MDLHVLSLIKKARGNQLTTSNDYMGYHRYCSARVRLLHSLRRRKLQRQLEHGARADLDENRLLMLLFLAEGVWSHAMATKQAGTACSHQRYIIQLAKAVKRADLFSRMCCQTQSPRSAVEATAYAAYMTGFYLMEGKQCWDIARENLCRAKAIYKTLASVDKTDQEIYQRILEDEIGPSILHCTNMMGMNGQFQPAGYFYWLNGKFALDDPRACSYIQRGQYLEAELDGSTPVQKELTVRCEILGAYQDARRCIREDLMAQDTSEAMPASDARLDLDRAVSCMILQQTLRRRELLLVIQTKSCFHELPSKQVEAAHEQKLVGFYDSLLETFTDLHALITSRSDLRPAEVAYVSWLTFNKLAFQAHRCFHLAQAHYNSAKYAQAHLLYQRAQEYAAAAFSSLPDEQQLSPEGQDQRGAVHIRGKLMELEELSKECSSQCISPHILGALAALREEDLLQCSLAKLSLDLTTKTATNRWERADILYEPGAVSTHDGEVPCNVQPLDQVLHQATPSTPFFLDTVMGNDQA